MKTLKKMFFIFLLCVLTLDVAFSVYALTEYFLADSGKSMPVSVDVFSYIVIAFNALSIVLIPVYFYLKKRSFYEN